MWRAPVSVMNDVGLRPGSSVKHLGGGDRAAEALCRYGFTTLPLERAAPGLLMVPGSVARVRVHAVIDTGAERSIGNEALRPALVSRHAQGTPDQIFDVTTHVQGGEMFESPPIMLGGIEIRGARITSGEVRIFEHWQLTQEPALLIGMDALGLLDALIIDYRRRELQLRTH